jgi:hypothetical protein
MVRVALSFGMTLPSLTHPPTGASESLEITKGRRFGREDDGTNSVYFENFQRELKQRLIVYVHTMYTYIHSAPFAVEALRSTTKKLSVSDLRKEIEVEVTLPGLPEDNILYQLYTDGMMKYEAFINYVSSKHSIPTEAFEKKPTITLKELRGIEPKPTTSSSSSSSKK